MTKNKKIIFCSQKGCFWYIVIYIEGLNIDNHKSEGLLWSSGSSELSEIVISVDMLSMMIMSMFEIGMNELLSYVFSYPYWGIGSGR